jgi:hypothetical protein
MGGHTVALTPPGRRKPPKRPNQERVDRLNALAKLHDEWVAANAEAAGFDPEGRPKRSDYNIHHVDLDAPGPALDALQASAAEILTAEAKRAQGAQLKHYWLRGAGLVKWNTWTELYAHLQKYLPPERAKRTAAEWFHERFGFWPGADVNRVRQGKPPRGDRIGPG